MKVNIFRDSIDSTYTKPQHIQIWKKELFMIVLLDQFLIVHFLRNLRFHLPL